MRFLFLTIVAVVFVAQPTTSTAQPKAPQTELQRIEARFKDEKMSVVPKGLGWALARGPFEADEKNKLGAATALGETALSAPVQQLPNQRTLAGRRAQLLAAARKDLPDPRVLQELAVTAGDQPDVRKTLLSAYVRYVNYPWRTENIFRASPTMPYWLVDGIAAGGAEAVPDILEQLKKEKPPIRLEPYASLVATLGRIGPAAKAAMPFLRARLAEREVQVEVQAATRVALANLGDSSAENLAAIFADLKDPKRAPVVLQAVIVARQNGWVTDTMVREISAATYGDDFRAAATLGALGNRAVVAQGRLGAAQAEIVQRSNGNWLTYSLAISRVDPGKRNAELRAFCKNLEHVGDCKGAWLALTYSSNSLALSDRPTLLQLTKLVEDEDKEVSEGAVWLLQMIGITARESVPGLIRFMQGNKDEERRAHVAFALADIADFSQVPNLEAALKSEKSDRVRAELHVTIEMIRSLDPPPGRRVIAGFTDDWALIWRYRGMTNLPCAWALWKIRD